MKLVTEKAGRPVTNSLKVSQVFEKEHKNVIQSIENIQETLEALGEDPLNFQPISYLDSYRREQPMYDMDRDAFAVLVFGFRGDKALKFKVDFIKAFNEMELELMKAQAKLIDPSNIPEALRLLAISIESNSVQETEEEQYSLVFPEFIAKSSIKPKRKMQVSSVPRHTATAAVRYQLKKMGLRPVKTTEHFVKEGLLKHVQKRTGTNETRKVPTERGKKYFYSKINEGLYLKFPEGHDFIQREKDFGRIPDHCFQKVIA